MSIAVGVWVAFAGALALLVGVTARRHVRRLRHSGVKAWATATIIGSAIAVFAP